MFGRMSKADAERMSKAIVEIKRLRKENAELRDELRRYSLTSQYVDANGGQDYED